jgi:HTH-type transcriptional regulator/antitoxin HigA
MSLSDPDITRAVAHWHELAGAGFVPHSEAEYLHLVAVLDRLIDEVGADESHPLASLMEVVGALIPRTPDGSTSSVTCECDHRGRLRSRRARDLRYGARAGLS